jgi:hypothetical protein
MAGPEKIVEDKIKKYLTQQGYWHMKVWGGSGVKKGVPDILTCIKGHFVSLEVKRADGRGRITMVQKKNAKEINENDGIAVFISQLETLKVVEAYLLNDQSIDGLNFSDKQLEVLHLNDESHSIMDKESYEGVWR